MELIDKAIELCIEIEERQRELRAILAELSAEKGPQPEAIAAPEPEVEIKLEFSAGKNHEDNPQPLSSPEPIVAAEPQSEPILESICQQATHTSVDMRKVFTLNDRFRFRRELFAGDDNAFVDFVDRLGECKDYNEAESLISKQEWPDDNDALADFKEIVATHFNGYKL